MRSNLFSLLVALVVILSVAFGTVLGNVYQIHRTAVPVPPYVVKLTRPLPGPGTCTGVLINARHVLTAEHCSELPRVVTQSGTAAKLTVVDAWPRYDVAVLETSRPLHMPEYARFREPRAGSGRVIGECPHFFYTTSRHALFLGTYEFTSGQYSLQYDAWVIDKLVNDESKVCGGDSGGVVIQNGYVVGLTSMVASEYWWEAIGSTFFTTSGRIISGLLEG